MNSDWRERLAAYDDPHLDERERAALEVLLNADPEAREYLAQLRIDAGRYREALASVTARPGFATAVMARVQPAPAGWWQRAALALRPRALEVAAVGVMALAAFAFLPRSVQASGAQECQANLHYLSRAMATYAQDWDERLPGADTWVAATSAYRQRDALLQCPDDKRSVLPTAPGEGIGLVSYGMSPALGGRALPKLVGASSDVLLRDAEGPFLAARHDRRANVAFANGEVGTIVPSTANSAVSPSRAVGAAP